MDDIAPTGEMRTLPSHYAHCFGCGRSHPTGLHLSMAGDGARVRGSFLVTEHHQGAPGLAHGGVLSAAVDEGMGFLMWLLRKPGVTARLEVNFRRPVPVGSVLQLEGEVERVEGRKIYARMVGRIEGEVVIDARSLFIEVGLDHFAKHGVQARWEAAERLYNP